MGKEVIKMKPWEQKCSICGEPKGNGVGDTRTGEFWCQECWHQSTRYKIWKEGTKPSFAVRAFLFTSIILLILTVLSIAMKLVS